MKRNTILIVAIFVCSALAAQEADRTIERFFTKLHEQTLVGRFTATENDNKGSVPTTYKGFIEMRGEIFRANIWEMEISYDGTTLAVYNPDVNELTLSYPQREEIEHVNPLLYAKRLVEHCHARLSAMQPEGEVVIDLTPKDPDTGILEITLQLRKSDLMPLSISIREVGMLITTLVFEQQQWSHTAPNTDILSVHNTKQQPYINDLR